MKEIGRKQLLRVAAATFMAMLLMVPTTSWAQNKPWAKLADGVLTFSYGAKPAAESANIKCPKCEKPIAAAHKFCPNCGTEKPKPKSFVFAVPLNAKGVNDLPWDENREEVKRVVFSQSFRQVSNITSTAVWFFLMKNLTSITGLENLRTGNVTNMDGMFSFCKSLTSLDLSNFNTSKVTNMESLFSGCDRLTSLDLSNFNTSNVTNMESMFSSCERLTSLDLSNFNTSNVTNMAGMFSNCKSLTSLDLSNFNTSKVTNMESMFSSCERLTSLDLSNFNTSKVTDMGTMFSSCERLTSLNLSNFNTSKVTDMGGMFSFCKSLTSLNLSNFNTSKVTDMGGMFYDTPSLKTITVSSTTWNLEKADTKTMFRGCPAQVIKK